MLSPTRDLALQVQRANELLGGSMRCKQTLRSAVHMRIFGQVGAGGIGGAYEHEEEAQGGGVEGTHAMCLEFWRR
jgi:hypothetical protein